MNVPIEECESKRSTNIIGSLFEGIKMNKLEAQEGWVEAQKVIQNTVRN